MRARLGNWKRACCSVAVGLTALALCVGANTVSAAALLSLALCLVLLAAAFLAPAFVLQTAIARRWLSIFAGLGFIGLGVATAWVSSTDQAPLFVQSAWHPVWRELMPGHGAISLAPYRTIEGVVRFFGPAAAFAIGAVTVHDREDRREVSGLVLLSAAALAAVALFAALQTNGGPAGLSFANSKATAFGVLTLFLIARVTRIAGRPLSNAAVQVPTRLKSARILLAAPVTISVLAFTLGCLVMTGALGVIAATGAGALLFGALMLASLNTEARAPGAPVSVLALTLVLAATAFCLAAPAALTWLFGGDPASLQQSLVELHWRIFLERPWWGHGLNTFDELNSHFLAPEIWPSAAAGAPLNLYICALEESGILGVALLALCIAPSTMRAAWTAITRRPGAEWAAAAFCAVIMVLGLAWVGEGLVSSVAALLGFALGAFAHGDVPTRASDEQPRRYINLRASQAMPSQRRTLTAIATIREK